MFPKEGETIKNLAPLFKWQPVSDVDKGDKIANHEILISFDPLCRWPVATALYKETRSGNRNGSSRKAGSRRIPPTTGR